MDIMNFKQSASQSAVEYQQPLGKKSLPCEPVFDQYPLDRTFTKGLKQAIQQTFQIYLAKNKSGSLQ